MNIVIFIIGFLLGAVAVLVLRPAKKGDDVKLAQYNALLAQQKQDIEKLRLDNMNLVRESAENKKEAETLASVREKMLNDFKAVSAELIEKQ